MFHFIPCPYYILPGKPMTLTCIVGEFGRYSLRRLKERLHMNPSCKWDRGLVDVREKQNGFCQFKGLNCKLSFNVSYCSILLRPTLDCVEYYIDRPNATRWLGKAAVSPIGCIGTSLGLCGTQLLNLHLIYLIYFDIYYIILCVYIYIYYNYIIFTLVCYGLLEVDIGWYRSIPSMPFKSVLCLPDLLLQSSSWTVV